MAYEVKFRLEFSDDLENSKKIEILKNGYSDTGPVYDLIGTSDPVQISWDQDDNLYDPIIGSTCQINLFVTDTTNYDDFYIADEREYKIKISYKDSNNNYYSIVGFFTPQWAEEWGGELNIEGKVIKYNPGDFILFESTKLHQSKEIKKIPYWRTSVSYMIEK